MSNHSEEVDIETFNGFSETIKLYGGEVELRYADEIHSRWIEIDGVRYMVPGVTNVCGMIDKSGALTQWAANETINYLLDSISNNEAFKTSLRESFELAKSRAPVVDFALQRWVVDTGTLGPLLNEARFNFRKISKTATDIGHTAHSWLEEKIKHQIRGEHFMAALPEGKAVNCIHAALEWMDRHKFRPVSSERHVYSKLYNYSGTKDWDAFITGCGDPGCCPFIGEVFAVGDFKSSKNLYDDYRVQLAAYQQATEEEFPDQIVGARVLLRLDKEGDGFEPLVMTHEEFETDLDGFLGALQLYNWKQQLLTNRRNERADAKAERNAARPKKKARKAPRKVEIRAKQLDPIPVES